MSQKKDTTTKLKITVYYGDGRSKSISFRANAFTRELSEKINGFLSSNLIKK